jgi:hypothetical protein
MAEQQAMNKPSKSRARPLSEVLGKTLSDAFAKQGFASTELVTRWTEIVGPEIASHSQPEKIQWLRPMDGQPAEPGTLVLRVEGPTAIEIQHLSAIILERVNRFFGWQAIGGMRLRQAPLRRDTRKPHPSPDPEAMAAIAKTLPEIQDEGLRQALARLGAAIKQA